MRTAQQIKNDLDFSGRLVDVIEVMKRISLVKYQALEKKRLTYISFSRIVADFFRAVNLREINHIFVTPEIDRLGIVVVTSDRGFMGGLNIRVCNSALAYMLEKKNLDAEFIVIGTRGHDYIKSKGRENRLFKEADYPDRDSLIRHLRDHIIEEVKNRKFGRLSVFFPVSLSFLSQEVKRIDILPVTPETEGSEDMAVSNMIIESPIGEIIDCLVRNRIFYGLLESLDEGKLAEYSARTVHLEQSRQNLERKVKNLRFQYLKARHSIIDRSIRETFLASLIRKAEREDMRDRELRCER